MTIRAATESDLTGIAAIYGHEAHTGISTFDTEPRSIDEWRDRLESTAQGDHLLVATEEETILGYAQSSAYRPKPCYAGTREASIYLAPGETLKLRIFIDKSVVEVFANDRQCVTTRVYPGREDSAGITLRAQGAEATLRSLDVWQMHSIYAVPS